MTEKSCIRDDSHDVPPIKTLGKRTTNPMSLKQPPKPSFYLHFPFHSKRFLTDRVRRALGVDREHNTTTLFKVVTMLSKSIYESESN
jgi:hypothetical protein